MLGAARLSDNGTVYNSQVTAARNRNVAQFIIDKTTPGDNCKRYAIMPARPRKWEILGSMAPKIASVKRSYYTLNSASSDAEKRFILHQAA